jgi:two-component system phosphate regulon sensor histidine kinase PhoR
MVIFYCLIIYAIFQLIWWGRLLLIANPNSKGMVLGETAVFLFIFFVGAYYLQKAIDQERKLHHQAKKLPLISYS